MLAKRLRLTTQDIQRLLRRGQRISTKRFLFLTASQNNQRPYNQWAFQLPLKVDKRAVMRNAFKRAFYDTIATADLAQLPTKTFICLHKNVYPEVAQLIASGDKTTILATRNQWCIQDLQSFHARKGTVLSTTHNKSARSSTNGWSPSKKENTKATKQ